MDTIPTSATPLAEQLATLGAQLHAILTHMEAWEAQHGPRPDGAAVPQVLAEVLVTVVASYVGDHVSATRILTELGELVERDLFFVRAPER